jgi:ankyrin repeat protein
MLRIFKETRLDLKKRQWENGMNALHLASKCAKTTELIDIILENEQFDISQGDNDGSTPLHYAIKGINPIINARHLIEEKGADPNISDKDGATPLHIATANAKNVNLSLIDLFLKNKQVNINASDNDGRTALHFAIDQNNVNVVRALLENGADPTIRDKNDRNQLQWAAAAATESLIEDTCILDLLLANKNIKIDEMDKFGMTALHYAIMNSNVTTFRCLIDNGANPNVTNKDGRTPLHDAARLAKDMEIVELLLNQKDLNVNYLDNEGKNPLHYAKDNKHGLGKAIANRLREEGAVNEPTKRDKTFVDKMIKELKGLLVKRSEICSNEGQTDGALWKDAVAIDKIIEKSLRSALEEIISNSDVIKLRVLIETGIDIRKATWEGGMNALHAASKHAKTTDTLTSF